jgi:hypothetical protein
MALAGKSMVLVRSLQGVSSVSVWCQFGVLMCFTSCIAVWVRVVSKCALQFVLQCVCVAVCVTVCVTVRISVCVTVCVTLV